MPQLWKKVLTPFLAVAAVAMAQNTTPLRLSLRDAVQLALKQNPQVIIANLGVDLSRQDTRIARSALLPQVSGNVSETVHRVNLQSAIGLTFPNFPQHVGPFYVFQGGVEFGSPIFDLTLWSRYRSAQLGTASEIASEVTVREQSVLLVVSQYLGAQRAAANLAAAQSRVDLAQALYDQALDLQKNGVGTGIDTLRANVELQNEKQRLLVARTQLDTTLYGLAQLLSIDPHRPIEITDQPAFFDISQPPLDESIEHAYQNRPELRQILNEERRALINIQTAGQQRLPRFSLNGFWVEQGLTPTSIIPVYQYQVNLDFPIFTGGRIQAQRAEANIALRELKEQERSQRDQIALQVKTAAAQLDSARNEVDVANLGLKLAQQEVVQARDRFQAGVANNIEVISAQDALARANDNQIAALYRYNQARADLAHAQGQMEALYAR